MTRTASTFAPPVVQARRWLAEASLPAGLDLINVSQAAPISPPTAALRQAIAEIALTEPQAHLYGPVLGLPTLRAEIAQRWCRDYGGPVRTDQVAVTSGCNEAFCAAIATLLDEGDEVILPVPWYFNHKMALDMAGAVAVPLPVTGEMLPDVATARSLITDRTRAIALVSPNNPTGVEYPADLLAAFFDLAQEAGITLILDETYRDFHSGTGTGTGTGKGTGIGGGIGPDLGPDLSPDLRTTAASPSGLASGSGSALVPGGSDATPGDATGTPRPPHELFQRKDWDTSLIQLYSFSKAYRLTGHRVGAMIGSPERLLEVEKYLDTVTICPAQIGQFAALWGMQNLGDWLAGERVEILKRGAAIRDGFGPMADAGWRLLGSGAYFAYLEHPFDLASDEIARRMVSEIGVLMLPGVMFTPDPAPAQRDTQDPGRGQMRVAFANLDRAGIADLIDRLAGWTP